MPNGRKLLLFFVIPLVVPLTLAACYFSGVDVLQQIITPRIFGVSDFPQREFGLLENLQNIVLLAMIAIAVTAFRRKENYLEKILMGFIAAFVCFVFLEEIDYGLHFYELAAGVPPEEAAKVRNLHNVGDRTSHTKQIVDFAMVLYFGLFPFAMMLYFRLFPFVATRTRHALLRYLCPDPYSVLTLLAAWLVRTITHTLQAQGLGEGGGIEKNISEFRELVTYYLFMLYLWNLALLQNLPARRIENTKRGPKSAEGQ